MTQPRSQPACNVGPARQISRAAASGALPTRALPSESDQRSAAPPTGRPNSRLDGPAEIDHQRLQARIEDAEAHANDWMAKPACVKASREGADKRDRLRIVAMNAESADAAFVDEPDSLLGRLGRIVDEGIRFRARHQAAVGPIAAVGESFGDESLSTQRLDS